MNRTELSTKLIEGVRGARQRPLRLLAMLSLVVVIAAACSSEAATATSDDAASDEQSSATTAPPAVEEATTTTAEVESVTTTAGEPEPEPETESEANPAPDTAVAEFTAAFGVDDADKAWSFVSDRCGGGVSETPDGYSTFVAGYALDVPGATAENITTDVFGDVAAISYDVHNDSGEFFESYADQPWVFSDGNWYHDHC